MQAEVTPSPEQENAAPGNDAETLPSTEELLKQAELKAQEHYDAWLRAKAETENMRKRAQEDVSKAHKFAIENFSSELL
ncbi:MAG: nucleotide exchange factor GrpE, partial [Sulfuricellaceae bacterium]